MRVVVRVKSDSCRSRPSTNMTEPRSWNVHPLPKRDRRYQRERDRRSPTQNPGTPLSAEPSPAFAFVMTLNLPFVSSTTAAMSESEPDPEPRTA